MATFTALSPEVMLHSAPRFPARTLEPFTCGLASENTIERAERLIALIVRDLSWYSAMRPSIALLSRPDHNAADPFAWSISALQTEHVSDPLRPSRNCQRPADPQARSSPQPVRDGAERSGVA